MQSSWAAEGADLILPTRLILHDYVPLFSFFSLEKFPFS